MPSLKNKKILLGVTGGIAAYKTPMLVRLLVKAGAEVRVICTPSALSFVTAETLSVVSKNPVYSSFFKTDTAEWNNHVEFGLWADVMLIAPATANTLSAMATGRADNLLLTTYLSSRCPVIFAPAMDLDMFRHASVQRNIEKLKSLGHLYIQPGTGDLASGLVGEGRMAEPEEIATFLEQYFAGGKLFSGKKILVTAGPTYENIDPVRFIGNYSSGKMGFAIAESFAEQGADVTLITGPVSLNDPEDINTVRVTNAEEMHAGCMKLQPEMDIIFMTAAVADYRPESTAVEKIKKREESLELKLVKNPDILSDLGKHKPNGQFLAGFALETQNEEANALEKMKKKNLDLMILNSLRDTGAGFGHDTNKVTVYSKQTEPQQLPLQSKSLLARELVDITKRLYNLQGNI